MNAVFSTIDAVETHLDNDLQSSRNQSSLYAFFLKLIRNFVSIARLISFYIC